MLDLGEDCDHWIYSLLVIQQHKLQDPEQIIGLGCNSGILKSWCAPKSLKLPCNCQRARKQFLRQSNTVPWFVLGSHMSSPTNKNTVFPRARKKYLFQGNTVLWFVLISHMASLTNENTVLLWRRNCFLWKRFLTVTWEFLCYWCALGFWNARILHALTIDKRTMPLITSSLTKLISGKNFQLEVVGFTGRLPMVASRKPIKPPAS